MGAYFQFEKKFGHLGIPGLIRILAFFRLFIWVLTLVNADFLELLYYDRAKILQGEVWRIFSFVLIPRAGVSAFGPFYALIELMFLFFIGDMLEQAWGPFGVTCYLFGSILTGALLGLIGPFVILSEPVTASLIMAAACLYPDVEILLFLIIPIRLKWIGMLSGGLLLFLLLGAMKHNAIGGFVIVGLPLLAMLVPFFLVFLPRAMRSMRHQTNVAARRSKFERGKIPESDAFHKCGQCGSTEITQPDREFRIAADGEEYCSECKPSKPETN